MLNINIIVFISHPHFNKECDGVSPLWKKKVLSDRIINELIYEGKTWEAKREENSRGKKMNKRQEPVQRFCGVRDISYPRT